MGFIEAQLQIHGIIDILGRTVADDGEYRVYRHHPANQKSDQCQTQKGERERRQHAAHAFHPFLKTGFHPEFSLLFGHIAVKHQIEVRSGDKALNIVAAGILLVLLEHHRKGRVGLMRKLQFFIHLGSGVQIEL